MLTLEQTPFLNLRCWVLNSRIYYVIKLRHRFRSSTSNFVSQGGSSQKTISTLSVSFLQSYAFYLKSSFTSILIANQKPLEVKIASLINQSNENTNNPLPSISITQEELVLASGQVVIIVFLFKMYDCLN
ncbi:hypothetical protein MJO28_016273 [Puccinia striiformis f. sp. tritici]|uniref:Uncharacterized protein n=1 Tax=Puccinia striiformis f. sp. tritici TaxID=168172 RepID=A0ACC0DMZ2_9BASI|nr:hypothetical protein MJO28_016273 [Puccinia striiformis f. sp. tritici]